MGLITWAGEATCIHCGAVARRDMNPNISDSVISLWHHCRVIYPKWYVKMSLSVLETN